MKGEKKRYTICKVDEGITQGLLSSTANNKILNLCFLLLVLSLFVVCPCMYIYIYTLVNVTVLLSCASLVKALGRYVFVFFYILVFKINFFIYFQIILIF